jgi:hypothetical protein
LKGQKMLETRCSVITEWLGSMNISVEQTTTTEIISLLFRYYNPLLQGNQAEQSL